MPLYMVAALATADVSVRRLLACFLGIQSASLRVGPLPHVVEHVIDTQDHPVFFFFFARTMTSRGLLRPTFESWWWRALKVSGPPLCTWFPRRVVRGGCAGTTGCLNWPQRPSVTHYPICRTLQLIYSVAKCFRSLIWFKAIPLFLLRSLTFLRRPSLPLLASLSMCTCPLGCVTLQRPSSVSWTSSFVTTASSLSTWMTFWWPAAPWTSIWSKFSPHCKGPHV